MTKADEIKFKLQRENQALKKQLDQYKEMAEKMSETIDSLKKWNIIYPAGRIYPMERAKKIESELTEIVNSQIQALTAYEKLKSETQK